MKWMLSCLLALPLLVASSGCHLAGRNAEEVAVVQEGYSDVAGCEDGSCAAVGLAGEGALVEGTAVCEGDACCDPACRRHHHLRGLLANARDCSAGGHCGLAKGPSMGAVVYPYYTVRGPRDFLLDDPPSIGP
jgi:hypothetical protein